MKNGESTLIPASILADLDRAIQIAMTGVRDPDFERRIHAEAEQIREEVFRKHGVLDIGTPAIRELRDSE